MCQSSLKTWVSSFTVLTDDVLQTAAKVVQHPYIIDYYRYIAEEDEKQFVSIRLMIMDIRNNYSSIHDLIIKNIDVIKNPSSSAHSSLY